MNRRMKQREILLVLFLVSSLISFSLSFSVLPRPISSSGSFANALFNKRFLLKRDSQIEQSITSIGALHVSATTDVTSTSGTIKKVEKPLDSYKDIDEIPIWEVPKELRRRKAGEKREEEDRICCQISSNQNKEKEGDFLSNRKVNSFFSPSGASTSTFSSPYLKYYSLEDLFHDCDGEKLATLFDESYEFRHAIRLAMRDDLFVSDPKRSEKANMFIKDINSSLHVKWDKATATLKGYGETNGNSEKDEGKKVENVKNNSDIIIEKFQNDEDKDKVYKHLTKTFTSYGLEKLDGPTFLYRLGSLCGISNLSSGKSRLKGSCGNVDLNLKRFGSLIDIVNIGRYHLRHSWHQDCGTKDFYTAMLGFPRENNYEGVGVFSHCFKLSHRLTTQLHGEGNVIEYEQLMDALSKLQGKESLEDATSAEAMQAIQERYQIDEKFVLKPWYSRGKEIIVYDDSTHLHSAPNHIYREAIWRFM